MGRPGGWQAKTVLDRRASARRRSPTCVTPTTLTAINPADVPDVLHQVSGIDRRRRSSRTRRSSSPAARLHAPGSHHVPVAARCRRSCCRPTATSTTPATTARSCSTRGVDHKLIAEPDADGPLQRRPLLRHQSERCRRRHQRAERRRAATRARSWTTQVNHTAVLSPNLLNEARFAYLNGDPVTKWEAQALSTTYTRAGSVPFTIGQSRVVGSVRPSGAVLRHAVVDARHALRPLRRQPDRTTPPAAPAASPAPRSSARSRSSSTTTRAVRPAHAGRRAAVHPADQLRHHRATS